MKTEAGKTIACPYCGVHHSKKYLCEGEFEGWEIDYELREAKDYLGLIAHYKAVLEWQPGSAHGFKGLGEAYVLNNEPEKALKLLREPHRRYPGDWDLQYVILDALFALGKDESDFDWVERIPVIHLKDSRTLDFCHAYLKPKRKPRLVDDLHCHLMVEGYCAFTREELLQAVRKDERFVVEEDGFWDWTIRARRKKDLARAAKQRGR